MDDIWEKAVLKAKKIHNIPSDSFVLITGSLLKTARQVYCAKLKFANKNKKNIYNN